MATQAKQCNTLEDLLFDDIGDPLRLKLSVLQSITNDFSEEHIIGSGGFGRVYKGVLGDEHVAVKRLYSFHAIEDEPFEREVDCLMRIRHCNIVWFVGYCAETSTNVVREGKKNIFVDSKEKLLCFEYLRNGSLRSHLTAGTCVLQWQICYKIIKGICLGLHYLHERQIIHLDLKPDNVLLDDSMVPKIADFGLSRLLSEEKSRMVTKRIFGTRRYMAPEYLVDGDITVKSDIYSLGLIIREMVLESWRRRLEQDPSKMSQTPIEMRYRQLIEACIKISETCIEGKPDKRPTTGDILRQLEKEEAGDWSIVPVTPAVEWISSLSRLMESIKRMTVTSPGQPTIRGEESKALQPGASQPEDKRCPDNKYRSCWLDATSNAKCYMLSSRLLKVTWGETPEHWKWITLPDSRGDGWMELKLAEFATDEKLLSEKNVIVDFREENDHIKKSGLIIEGMEFRPNKSPSERRLVRGLVLHARHTARAVAGKLKCSNSCAASSSRSHVDDEQGVEPEPSQGRCLSAASGVDAVGKRLSCCFLPSGYDDTPAGLSKEPQRKHIVHPPKLKFDRVEISKKMEDIVERLKPVCAKVATILESLVPLGHPNNNAKNQHFDLENRPKTSSVIIEPELFGRQNQKRRLAAEIIKGKYCDNDLSVVPIVGPGGIGKTTFIQHIYEEVKAHFQVSVWICVSQSFDANKLAQEIVKQMPKSNNEKENESAQEVIVKRIQSKQFIIVLDDMWTYHEDGWKTLLAPLKKGGTKGNMVIVTTRIPKVAKMVESRDCSIKLERLQDKDSMLLFQACVFDNRKSWEDYPAALKEVGIDIIKKLKGFPLAVKTVGRLLRDQLTFDRWIEVLDSKEWELQANDDDIMPALKLSYNYLPFHLQQCFSYCALFPEYYRFGRHELINLWIGLGLLGAGDQIKKIEDIGHDQRHVKDRMAFENHKEDLSTLDLVHLRYLRIKESLSSRTNLPDNISRFYHLLVLDVQYLDAQYNYGKLGFLREMGNLIKLRHFVVQHDCIHSNIPEVGKLKSLQELRRFEVKKENKGFELVQIGQLLYLQGSLGIYNLAKVEEIKEADGAKIALLNRLYGLKLDWGKEQCNKDPIRDGNILESLKPHCNLRELNITGPGCATCPSWLDEDFSIRNLESLHIECVNWDTFPLPGKLCMTEGEERQGCITSHNFHNLKSLELVSIPKLRKWHGNGTCSLLPHLQNLTIRDCPELIELPLSHSTSCQFQQSMMCFPELKEISLSDCPNLLSFRPIPWTQSLCHVSIEKASDFEQLDYKNGEQSELILRMKKKYAREGMFWDVLDFNNLREVQEVYIGNCPPISLDVLKMLTCLKTLVITNSSNILLPVDSEKNIQYQYELPVETLNLSSCGASGKELTQVLSHFPKLSKLSIWNCQNVTTLGVVGQQTMAAPESSPSPSANDAADTLTARQHDTEEAAASASGDERLLLLPPQLQELTIRGFQELDSGDIAAIELHGLPSLQSLSIFDCPKLLCSSSPSHSHFPTTLQQLSLFNMEGMETLPPLLPNLTRLDICYCRNLTGGEVLKALLAQGHLTYLQVLESPTFFLGSEQDDVHHYTSGLQVLRTDDFAGVLAAPICRLLSSSLTDLHLHDNDEVECFTKEQEEALQILTSIQDLQISRCNKLVSLPTGLDKLPNLRALHIRECLAIRSIGSLPDSLQQLDIASCPAIHSLPKDGLPGSLQEICVRYCENEELNRQCQKIKGTIPIVIA
uniref:Protein kinase domain-containing protein n=1 Tax=Oryza punctata TaxID=4537 RepID=A0A0E0MMH0_ORYPU